MRKILHISTSSPLSDLRQRVLSQQGFEVHTVGTLEEALEKLDEDAYDVILIGHTFAPSFQEDLVNGIRARSARPVLLVTANLQNSRIGLESSVSAFSSVDSFVQTIERVSRTHLPGGRRVVSSSRLRAKGRGFAKSQ